MRYILLTGLVVSTLAVSACSSSDSGTPATDGGTDGGSGTALDPANCVPPGTKPNELGMGGYCEPKNESGTRGGQCDKAGPDAGPRFCSGDVPDTPPHAWFCTYPCTKDEECGTGAYCAHDARGSGCVPLVCKSLQGDAGPSDSGSDSASDVGGDAKGDAVGD